MRPGLVQKLSPSLSGIQRRRLRGLAHPLKPIVQVGQAGVSESVVEQLDRALEDHELVKVKVVGTFDGELDEVAIALSARAGCACVQQIGHVLVFYRRREEDPVIDIGR